MKTGSRLETLLERGNFVLLAGLTPPASVDPADFLSSAMKLKSSVDAVVVGDSPDANVGISSLAGSSLLMREGIEPVLEVNCRDRNRIAMQSDVLGAAALGIENILCRTGLHQHLGDYGSSRNVYDMDVVQQVMLLRKIRDEKRLSNGGEIRGEPKLFIGVDDNPFGKLPELGVILLSKKLAAGADFVRTTPVFDLEDFSEWLKKIEARESLRSAPIIAGVLPLKNPEAARGLREFPGIQVPDALIRRMEGAENPEEEGMKIALEITERLKSQRGVRGLHFYAAGAEEMVARVIERAGLLPRLF